MTELVCRLASTSTAVERPLVGRLLRLQLLHVLLERPRHRFLPAHVTKLGEYPEDQGGVHNGNSSHFASIDTRSLFRDRVEILVRGFGKGDVVEYHRENDIE